jgi:putative Holliday junction resolvase
MARILGIDVGERRIGLAISDASGMLATPVDVLDVRPGADMAALVVERAVAQKAERLLVGLPLTLKGERGPAAEKALAFVEQLREQTNLPIATWDERFSTVSAQHALIEGGVRRQQRKQVVDKIAAQIFLQNYLDAQAFAAMPMPDDLDRDDPRE